MSVSVSLYTEADRDEWDSFVETKSRNGTLFHTRKFLGYHPEGRFTDASLIMKDEKNAWVAVLPAASREIDGARVLVSHPGASYGGLVLSAAEGVLVTGEVMDAIIAYAKEQGFQSIQFLRVSPPSIRRAFSDDQEYCIFQRGGTVTRFEMDGSVDIRSLATKDDVLPSLTGKCRNMVRQAERAGIQVRESDDFAAFWKILEATLGARHSAKPTHSLEEILQLKSHVGNGLTLMAAFNGSTMVGGIVIVTLHEKAKYTLYMAQDYEHQKDHPMHLILSTILENSVEAGLDTLHLGVSTEDGGKVMNEGLFFFKESFGCMPVRRESWELKL